MCRAYAVVWSFESTVNRSWTHAVCRNAQCMMGWLLGSSTAYFVCTCDLKVRIKPSMV
jgi:hypothetical protein